MERSFILTGACPQRNVQMVTKKTKVTNTSASRSSTLARSAKIRKAKAAALLLSRCHAALSKRKSRRAIVLDATITKRVRQGIKLLPRGWYKCIDINNLRMDSGWDCILGQLYGSFLIGREKLRISYTQSIQCGFSLAWADSNYGRLSDAWVRAINYRLNKDRTRNRHNK